MPTQPFLIYGANGYTGRLILEEAVRRGEQPIIAGRRRDELEALGRSFNVPVRLFDLEDPAAIQAGLEGVGVVLHCAGPFSATCAPMLEACLATGAHYLDITGEIDVFAHCHAQDARAKSAGVLVVPGVGFDVVPTDCLAAMMAAELPSAQHLVLAFDGGGGFSPGTAKTSVEGLGHGGRIRRDGQLQRVPLAWRTRSFDRAGRAIHAMTIPWGDVYTAFLSTGIPNIEVYMAVPPSTAKRLRRMRLLGPLLRLSFVQNFMKRRIEAQVRGPDSATRAKSKTTVWGEVSAPDGTMLARRLTTPNGYALTVTASLGVVEAIRFGDASGSGYRTPSQLMGMDYVLRLPGVEIS